MSELQEPQKKRLDDTETCTTNSCTESQTPTIQEIVQRYLPDVEWMDETRGRAPCPGRHKHTSRSHKNDCWVFINGVPTVSCLHDSCREEIAAVNSEIRSAYNLFSPRLDIDAMSAAREKAAKKHALEAKAKASLPEILKQYRWDYGHIYSGPDGWSEEHDGPNAAYKFLGKLFKEDDTLWCGDPTDSRPVDFATRLEWQTEIRQLWRAGRYTTASVFNPNSDRRSNDNVLKTPFMIVEGDKILGEPKTDEDRRNNKNACGAIFRWLKEGCGLSLRAVVDSGNKSLHGWFDLPSLTQFEEFKIVLPAMGCDRAMFKPSQPARLPGVMRENGKEQRLLYLK